MNRPADVVYFSLILIACLVGYLASTREPEIIESPRMTRFEAPSLPLDEPDLKLFAMPSYKARELPRLRLSHQMESVLREVRAGLLSSSVPARTAQPERIASLE